MALMAVAIAAALTGCSSRDQAQAHAEAEKAKQDLKQGVRETATGIKKAGDVVDRGAKKLKNKVDRELNQPDTDDTRRK